jgi:PhnB protein
MQLRPNLHFTGTAEDVLKDYQRIFGGDLTVVRFANSPAAGDVPPEWADKVLYGRLTTAFGAFDIMDAPPGRGSEPGGNLMLALEADDEAQGAALFAALADGGSVFMPYGPTFFAERFGMCTDRHGTGWLISVHATAAI